ncbi:MAG TPA: hypothetical protein VMZ92_21240 [Planctomycetota bacterium]|nr:hypothetical protein [Planctomycetota bacterium]
MAARTDKDIGSLIRERRQVDAALARGVREALLRHCRAGVPAVEWQDGKCVWLAPEELERRLGGAGR